MHLARQGHHPGRRHTGHVARLPDQRPELVRGVVLPEVVDAKVAVDPVGVEVKRLGVDARAEDEKVETVEGVAQLGKYRLDLRQVAEVAFFPRDICVGGFGFDGGDGLFCVVFFAAYDDYLG